MGNGGHGMIVQYDLRSILIATVSMFRNLILRIQSRGIAFQCLLCQNMLFVIFHFGMLMSLLYANIAIFSVFYFIYIFEI